jgi:hypothetical protein
MISYGSIPRRCDRAEAYLYLKEWTDRLLQCKSPKRKQDIARVLLSAAFDNDYVEGCAQSLRICGQTVRNHLKQQNPTRFLHVNRKIVKEMKRKGALSKPLILAIDWHDEMYYGNPTAEGVVGAVRKNGSNHAYRFATASVLLKGERLTLAVTPMLDRCALWHVTCLLELIAELDLTIKLLLFDRGYYSTALMRHLDDRGFKYIIHIPWHGKPLKAGVDRLHTTTTHKKRRKEQATFRLVTVRQRGKLLIFGTNTSFKRSWVSRTFRKRWGVETSYRMIGLFLAKTTSKRYGLRKLYFFLAVVLYNLWVLRNFRSMFGISVCALKHMVRFSLVLSVLPDLEAGG